jgi:hypothetical protein
MVRLFHFLVKKPVSRRLRGHQEESDQSGKYPSVGVNNNGALSPKTFSRI